jgi:hypothetical protein
MDPHVVLGGFPTGPTFRWGRAGAAAPGPGRLALPSASGRRAILSRPPPPPLASPSPASPCWLSPTPRPAARRTPPPKTPQELFRRRHLPGGDIPNRP